MDRGRGARRAAAGVPRRGQLSATTEALTLVVAVAVVAASVAAAEPDDLPDAR
ncbi:hypothetical protein [Prauserella cavernicola]|uniref:Uncharacterized protein n=1 Tax=Prauserella cavernicola TaxID=2800127 RepID=A0A934QY07_9PSEU|nr:hypothetical protein [Prauserella cavernicola]MBK1787349.1 hypothetical protein [Prauserella cavernicola]